jgi:VanZ family protein
MISFFFSLNQFIRIFLVVLYAGSIATLSLLPPQDFPSVPLFEGADKIVHFFMYFIFSFLLCWAFKTENRFQRWLLVLPVAIGWGIFMEYTQLYMHLGRSFSWYDILANSFGVMCGIIIFKYALMLRIAEKVQNSE